LKPRLVYRGLVYDEAGLRKASIVVGSNGYVQEVGESWTSFSAEVVLDHREDKHVIAFPGFIDMHVHLRDFNEAYKETVETGTRAAARGGITLIGDMPNTDPRINSYKVLLERKKLLSSKSLVDYYVYIYVPERGDEVEAMVSDPDVRGMKLHPDGMRQRYLDRALKVLAEQGKIVVVHSENPFMIDQLKTSVSEHRCYRSVEVELWGIRLVGDLISTLDLDRLRVHVTHVTNLYTYLEAKRYGFSTDTCPHYLLLDSDHYHMDTCYMKVVPPIRGSWHRTTLLELFSAGYIDILSSDHAPHGLQEKTCCPKTCPAGINGIEIMGPLMGDLYVKGVISLSRIYRALSLNPAKVLGLKRYGYFRKGYRGNITVIDLSGRTVVDPEKMAVKSKYSVYRGFVFSSSVKYTVVGGRVVYPEELSGERTARGVGEVEKG